MVQINKKKFKVYNLDTQQSILNRIAADMETIPKYLYFPLGIPTLHQFHSDKDIIVEDLLNTIITAANDDLEFDFYIKNKEKFSPELSIELDILNPFIIYNKPISEAYEGFEASLILVIKTSIEKYNIFDRIPDIEDIWEKREQYITILKKSIKRNKEKSKDEVNLFYKFDKIKKGIKYTDFELENVIFELNLDLVNISLMEMFNNIQLNPLVPFAVINNFYKILKDFIPSPGWSIGLEDGIIVKILESKDENNIKIKNYRDAIISVSGSHGKEEVICSLHLTTTVQNLSREDFVRRFLNVMPSLGKIKIKSIRESKVGGVFYFPKHTINKYVFSDLVMNNSIFSNILSINESDKASKKKLHIHFDHPLIGYITANITSSIVVKGKNTFINKSGNDFPIDSEYIRIKISKCKDTEAVKQFQEILSRLFIIYDEQYDKIIADYRVFLPDFGVIKPKPQLPVSKKLTLKNIKPNIFISGYAKLCLRKPEIINDEEAKEAISNGQKVMVFPRKDSGEVTNNYICDHKEHKYPGLRNNPLSNSEKYPYIPCCYAKNQENVKGSKYRNYYYGEELPDKKIKQQELYITNKFVPNNKFGTLPKNISKLFNIINLDKEYMFVRRGVHRGKSSFLACVLSALGNDMGNPTDEDEENAYLNNIRDELSTSEYATICRQEMYDYTISEIKEEIGNPDVYLDPTKFVSMLEVYYDCNIYIFTRDYINGQLSVPRYIKSYYKTKRVTKSIFIFVHKGSDSNYAKYPQCELLGEWKTTDAKNIRYLFDYNDIFSKNIRDISNKLRETYTLNKLVTDVVFDIYNDETKIIGQGIDSYGKCRMVKIKYKGNIVTMLTSPTQPLITNEIDKWDITKISKELVVQIASIYKMIITKQTVIDGIIKEIHGIIGNVNVIIPTVDDNPIGGVPTTNDGLSYPENTFSNIEIYNKYKKMTRYIVEYMYWLYSTYLYDIGDKKPTLKNMLSFQREKIKIVPKFNYDNVPKKFSKDNNGIINNGKLVVKSDETLKRLMYILRSTSLRNIDKIIDYRTRTVIENYYVDISDFTYYPTQVILEGDESVDKWINEHKINYNLNNEILVQSILPYFFKNNFFGDKVFLAQNTDNIDKAVKIAQTWYNEQYNPLLENNPEEKANVTYNLYSYVNDSDIIPYKVIGKEIHYDINIIGYKVEDMSLFTVLLPL